VRAVLDAGIEPVVYGGASAGAMTAAAAASGRLDRFRETILKLRRRDFWDPGLPFGAPPGLLRGRRFRALLGEELPATFADCSTPVVTVSTNLNRRARHVDTHGDLPEAVLASCALPLLFRPVRRAGELHVDGGLVDKVPINALLEHHDVDVLLVYLIPSSSLSQPWGRTPWRFLDQALDLVRDDGWRQQVALAEARGVEVQVLTGPPGRLGPFALGPAADVMSEAHALTRDWLAEAVTPRT
jgi:predicted acylesterase/phospholipase RssA